MLQRISNMVLTGEIEPKQANSVILACNAILAAIKTDEQAKKIQELETLLHELEQK